MAATVKQLLDCAVLEARHADVTSVLDRMGDDLRRVDLFDVGAALSDIADIERRKHRETQEDHKDLVESIIDEAAIYVGDVYPDMGDALRRHLKRTFSDN